MKKESIYLKLISSLISQIIIITFWKYIYCFDISSLKVTYFNKNTYLYYVNSINTESGDLYLEFWGETSTIRYFIGLNLTSGEEIYFGNKKIKEIISYSNSIYHESIIININNENNIFSINYKNFDFINMKTGQFTYRTTNDIFFEQYEEPCYRNSIINLGNNNYLLSIILYKYSYLNYHHNILIIKFNFNSNNINGYNQINYYEDTIDYINSTTCFQTESKYIQCSLNKLFAFYDFFTIGLFDSDLKYIDYINIAYIEDNIFTKIFHIKKEIGAYIYFDEETNDPYIQIKELNGDKDDLIDLFENIDYINLNYNGRYNFNIGIFYSDGIKINDNKFIVILTTNNLLNLLICVFDLYNNDNSLRIKYYYLELQSKNIKISVNIRAFKYGPFFGITFYNSNLNYPGYALFNFPNYKKDNNYFNNNYNVIRLFNSSSPYLFPFPEIVLLNNIFGEEIIKIKIISFEDKSKSGIIIKSLNLDSEISLNDELELNDTLIFEQIDSGGISGKYILFFSPIIKEPYNDNSFTDHIECYGDTTEFYESKTFLGNTFRIIYTFELKFKSCNRFESDLDLNENDCNYNKEECICDNYAIIDENERKCCVDNCSNYIEIENEFEKYCIENCDNEEYIYKRNANEKYCLSSCLFNKELLYSDENNKLCFNSCSDNINENIYAYEKKCVDHCPENYIPDSNNICIYKEIEFTTNLLINTDEVSIAQNLENKINKKHSSFINTLISNYRKNMSELEIAKFDNNTLVSCYSSKIKVDNLITINSDLPYINLEQCEDLLIKENNLDENSDLFVVGKHYLNVSSKNNFDYELYTENGEKISNFEICGIEVSIPLSLSNYDYDNAKYLSQQGYDVFNLSSSFYYDVCLSAYINESDLSLGLRQKEILPKNNELCSDGCEYNGVNLDTKRLNCICSPDIKKNNETKVNLIEEVEQNFFIYIVDMINYQIIKCYDKIFDIDNYYYNFGFYIGFFLIVVFLILMLIFCFYGKKVIKIQYLHKKPNMEEIKKMEMDFNKNFQNIKYPTIEDNIILHKNKKRKKRKKIKKIKINNININIKQNVIQLKPNPSKKTKIRKKSKYKKKIKNNGDGNRLKLSAEDLNLIQSGLFQSSAKDIKINNLIRRKTISPKKIDKEEKIDYNELSYKEALEKDRRNILQIFISLFNLKLQTIQIIFFPKEFSHLSLTLSLYLFDIILDITINSLLFSDDVISQKYFNNGDLLFFTTNVLSISSNIISYFILYLTAKLINQNEVFDIITQQFKNENKYYRIFIKLKCCFRIKITIFYFVLFLIGLFCTYYLFLFCAIYKKTQEDLFVNYIVGTLWSLGFTVFICLFVAITRILAIKKRIKRLFIISKFIDDKF